MNCAVRSSTGTFIPKEPGKQCFRGTSVRGRIVSSHEKYFAVKGLATSFREKEVEEGRP